MQKKIYRQSALRDHRISLPDYIYVITKCLDGKLVPLIRLDNSKFTSILIDELFQLEKEKSIHIGGFVIMPDHVHFIVGLPDVVFFNSLSKIMNLYFGRTARMINHRLNRNGNFWQTGFYDHQIKSSRDFDLQLNYIHENPVRKMLVKEPMEWECSSINPKFHEKINWDWFYDRL